MYIAPPEIPPANVTATAVPVPTPKKAAPLQPTKSAKQNGRKSLSPPVVCRPRLNDRSSIANSSVAFHPYKGGKDASPTPPRRGPGRPRKVPLVPPAVVPPPPLTAEVKRLRALLPPRRAPPVPAILPAAGLVAGGGEEDTSRSIATRRPRRGAVVEMLELDLKSLEQSLRSRLRGTSREL